MAKHEFLGFVTSQNPSKILLKQHYEMSHNGGLQTDLPHQSLQYFTNYLL